jgi:hypothetical protein
MSIILVGLTFTLFIIADAIARKIKVRASGANAARTGSGPEAVSITPA